MSQPITDEFKILVATAIDEFLDAHGENARNVVRDRAHPHSDVVTPLLEEHGVSLVELSHEVSRVRHRCLETRPSEAVAALANAADPDLMLAQAIQRLSRAVV